MKKIKILSIMLMLTLVFALIQPATVNAAVKLNKSKVTLYIGDTITLKLSGTKTTPVWKSSDKSIATVNKKGKVKAKSKGSATITAIVGPGSTAKKYTCKITVKDKLIISSTDVTCYLDEYEEISASIAKPSENEYISFSQKGDDIIEATFSDDYTDEGYPIIRIIPNKIGTTEISIYATTRDGFAYDLIQEKVVKIRVYRDRSGWISEDDLDMHNVFVMANTSNITILKSSDDSITGITNGEDTIRIDVDSKKMNENEEYNLENIRFKKKKNILYFNISDLEALEIL